MMKVTGIIAEYNPLHRGHLMHIREAKRITEADAVIVVLSGNFTQRGEPAIVDKVRWTRMALAAGADAVLELPAPYATGSGEFFARGAIGILDSLGIVTDLVYGAETGMSARQARERHPEDPLWRALPDFSIGELDYRMEADAFSSLLHSALLRLPENRSRFIQDLSPELIGRLRRLRGELLTFTELAERLKTREVTRTRVNRALLHLLLDFPAELPPLRAVHILGLRPGHPVLRLMQDHTRLSLVTKMAEAPAGAFGEDLRADEIYRTAVWQKTGRKLPDAYHTSPVLAEGSHFSVFPQ